MAKDTITNGELLRKIRGITSMSAEDAAALMDVTPRMVSAWERGSQPMPRTRLELMVFKIQNRKEKGELFVIFEDGTPIDAVSLTNYISLKSYPGDESVVRTLATDIYSGQPLVHETRFKSDDNEHALRIARRWDRERCEGSMHQSIFDDFQNRELAVTVATSVARLVALQHNKNPRLDEIKSRIAIASREAEHAMTQEMEQAAQEQITKLSWELIREIGKGG